MDGAQVVAVTNLASGSDKNAGGDGGRPDMADHAAAVVRITKAVERFGADRLGGR